MFADATLAQPFVKFFYGSDNVPTQVKMLKQRIKNMRYRLDFESSIPLVVIPRVAVQSTHRRPNLSLEHSPYRDFIER